MMAMLRISMTTWGQKAGAYISALGPEQWPCALIGLYRRDFGRIARRKRARTGSAQNFGTFRAGFPKPQDRRRANPHPGPRYRHRLVRRGGLALGMRRPGFRSQGLLTAQV